MLIRTQDKRSLVDMTNLTIGINSKDFSIIAYHTNDLESLSYVILGTYSTEEKAMKVLDMIQEKYEDANCQYVHNTVFVMPTDKEVNV